VKAHARVGQGAEHLGVPREGVWFVVAVGKNGLHVQFVRQRRNFIDRGGVPHDQPAAERLQLGVELLQRFPDEFHPPVDAGEGVQNRPVEHENAHHLPAGPQGLVERCVVVHAQVAAKPHEPFGIGLVDGQ